jgi:hypothetical protein
MPSSFASPRNPFPLVHIGLIVVLTLLLSGWTCRAMFIKLDQLPNHRLQVIRETRIGIDVLYYSFAHRQRLEGVNESARQKQCEVERFLTRLRGFLPRMENLVAPALFDAIREKSHFRISGPDNVVQWVSRACGNTRREGIKSTLNAGPGGAASQNSRNTGNLISFFISMMGSCRRTFSRFQSERLYREVSRGLDLRGGA